MSAIERIKNDPRVADISDERCQDDGFWVYLKPGWCNAYEDPVAARCGDPLHIIHEETPASSLRVLRYIEKCTCKDCAKAEGVQ
jgi:hypothetical protein